MRAVLGITAKRDKDSTCAKRTRSVRASVQSKAQLKRRKRRKTSSRFQRYLNPSFCTPRCEDVQRRDGMKGCGQPLKTGGPPLWLKRATPRRHLASEYPAWGNPTFRTEESPQTKLSECPAKHLGSVAWPVPSPYRRLPLVSAHCHRLETAPLSGRRDT